MALLHGVLCGDQTWWYQTLTRRRTALHCVRGWYHYWHLCSISSLAVCLYKAIGGSFHSWIYNFHFSPMIYLSTVRSFWISIIVVFSGGGRNRSPPETPKGDLVIPSVGLTTCPSVRPSVFEHENAILYYCKFSLCVFLRWQWKSRLFC